MEIIKELQKRGLIQSISGEEGALEKWLQLEPRTIYFGFDPTAESLHIGHAVPLLIAKKLREAGHNIIILAGGATGMIGDPSFREEERTMMDTETLRMNSEKILSRVREILNDDSIIYVNNYDWFSRLNSLEYLREIGKLVSVHTLLGRESVQLRLKNESFFSYTEFSYSLIQGYDFAHLFKNNNCSVQIGGGDQWGNILMGVEITKKIHGKEVFGISCPLLIDSRTGRKFGKTEGGAVWLDPKLTSPYEMYQFFMSVDDRDVVKFLNIFSRFSTEDIELVQIEHAKNPEQRLGQKKLAFASVESFHGESAAKNVERASELLFGEGILTLSEKDANVLSNTIPTISVYEETNLLNVLVGNGIATSKRDGRQLIESKAIMVNGEIVGDENHAITLPALLRKGKRDYYLLTN